MKKYVSSEFVATKYGIYKAAQDIITSFPSTIIANGQNASAVIKGNMVQSGTPTPTTPIYPMECGDLSSGNYIIPVISGGVTTNIDLSAVQSRKIKKVFFTGSENWYASNQNIGSFYAYFSGTIPGAMLNSPLFCSHLQQSGETYIYGSALIDRSSINLWMFNTETTTTAFKNYLAQQYANGTPVTVWYVVEAETTTTLNEPIRKIGTYADSVAASAIPTRAGTQTFNIDTTLKPSEVDLTYTGWHMYDDKKYSGGEWG